ncbi:MAG: tetratricopeptide repeat protein [Nitrolancea sp.]
MTRATSSFARLLRYYRLAAGLTQEELAERSRLSARAISDLERGLKAMPHRQTVELLAEALELPIEDLERAVPRRRGPRLARERLPLPIPPTSFVGRDAEIRAVTNLLRQPETRLVTVTGPPGIGKTRLVLAVAETMAGEFADGVTFVPLAPIRDTTFVPASIAQALGHHGSDDGFIEQQLLDHLRTKHALLVVDNFEHVLDATSVLAHILATCPRVELLVSSRAALNIQGEHRFELGPLDLPSPGYHPVPDELPHFSAIQLFSERAKAVNPNFQVNATNSATIVEICQRLNGVPLAIELASARANVLSPPELVRRLESQLQVLTGGPSDLPERHQTMRGAITWSYELLNERERRLFRRLAYCAGGFTLETAEAIASHHDGVTCSVLDDLTTLVDKSLVMLAPGEKDEARFTMLEAIREFGLEQLVQSGEFETTADLHCEFFVGFAERSYLEQVGEQQSQWFRRLEQRQSNIRLAGRRIIATANGSLAVRFGLGLWRFWDRGHIQEGRDWLDVFLDMPDLAPPNAARIPLLFAAGRLAYRQADYASSMKFLEECLANARRLDDEDFIGAAQTQLGHIFYALGDLDGADRRYTESLAIRRKEGDTRTIGIMLHGLARIQRARADYAGARALLQERLTYARNLQDAVQISMALAGLGLIALLEGEHDDAEQLYRDSLTRSMEVDDQPAVATALLGIAFAMISRNEAVHARPLLEESLLVALNIGARNLIAECVEGFVSMLVVTGQPRRSWRLAAAVSAYRDRVKVPGDPSEQALVKRFLDRAAQSLTAEERNVLWDAGRSMTLNEALNDVGLSNSDNHRRQRTLGLVDPKKIELDA